MDASVRSARNLPRADREFDPDPATQFLAHVVVGTAALPMIVALSIPAVAWHAFVFMKAWNWFLPELFGVRPLSWAASLAVILVLMASKSHRPTPKDVATPHLLMLSYLGPAASLLTCWCFHLALRAGWLAY